jgi:hypothetical protein
MSTRDTTPYIEHTDTLPGGRYLHAVHNLTDEHVDLIRGMLREKRSNLTILLNEAPMCSSINDRLQQEANEIDNLILHLYPVRHPAIG